MEEALSCPCVADLKDGPCGKSFVAAFGCFIRSTADEKVYALAAAEGRTCCARALTASAGTGHGLHGGVRGDAAVLAEAPGGVCGLCGLQERERRRARRRRRGGLSEGTTLHCHWCYPLGFACGTGCVTLRAHRFGCTALQTRPLQGRCSWQLRSCCPACLPGSARACAVVCARQRHGWECKAHKAECKHIMACHSTLSIIRAL